MHGVTSPLCSPAFSFTLMKSAAGSFIFFSYLIFLLKFPPAHLRKPPLFRDRPAIFSSSRFPAALPRGLAAEPATPNPASGPSSCHAVPPSAAFVGTTVTEKYFFGFCCTSPSSPARAPGAAALLQRLASSLPGDLSSLLRGNSVPRRGAGTALSPASLRFSALKAEIKVLGLS